MLNHEWSRLIIEELLANGVQHFVLSPGSRSTPLAMAAILHPDAETVVHFDERGAAFYALGYARAACRPAVLICTSGTAVANYFPAIVEACQDHIPMLVLTADRPPELLFCGANQAIDQTKIFSSYAKSFFSLPCPDEAISDAYVSTTIDQAVYQSMRSPKGVVHLNCSFREPLHEKVKQERNLRRRKGAFTEYAVPEMKLSLSAMQTVMKVIGQSKRGLLLIGRVDGEESREALASFAKKLNWPVFADIASGLRLGFSDSPFIPFYDLLLQQGDFDEFPDCVLHFGGGFTSKALDAFLKKSNPCSYLMIQDHPFRQDPNHVQTIRLEADVAGACRDLEQQLGGQGESDFLPLLRQASLRIESFLQEELSQPFDEIYVAKAIVENTPEEHALFLSSSLSIRHMDRFVQGCHYLPVSSNRGASGIDGTVASACGFAKGYKRPVTLLMGDLAFLHDLNSLAFLQEFEYPITIVLLNNQGGGIFSMLPISEDERVFKKAFETPHALHFEQAANLFSIDFCRPMSQKAFSELYSRAMTSKRSTLIEVMSSCRGIQRRYKEIQEALRLCV